MTERPPDSLGHPQGDDDDFPDLHNSAKDDAAVFGEQFFMVSDGITKALHQSKDKESVRGTNPHPENTPVPGLGLINDGVVYSDSEVYD